MKKTIYIIALSMMFFLASCCSLFGPGPVMERSPDVINQPTNTLITKDTHAEIPKGTYIKTDTDAKVEAILGEETLVTVKKEDPQDPKAVSLEKPMQVILAKNTKLILPENTYFQTTDSIKAKLEASTEVILPVGTEITTSKINWYAILFYSLLVFCSGWYYLQTKEEDNSSSQTLKPSEPKDNNPIT